MMLASVKGSPTTCSFRPPVQGDDELPNQCVAVEGKILKKTPKSVRGRAFIEVDRARRRRRHRLHAADLPPEASASSSTAARPAAASRRAARATRSRRSTSATGIQIVGHGRRRSRRWSTASRWRASTDSNPGQVKGRKVRFAIGSRAKKKNKKVKGTFKRVSVSVPNP